MNSRFCGKCNHHYEECEYLLPGCPECGCEDIVLRIFDKIPRCLDEFHGKSEDPKGNLVSERIMRSDLNSLASVSTDQSEPSRISISRRKQVANFSEEGQVASSFVGHFNFANKTNYSIEEKNREDYDYSDRIMVSETDFPKRIQIQIRNLDEQIIAVLGRTKHFSGQRDLQSFILSISRAIQKKSLVDPKEKANSILLLTIPTPIGDLAKCGIENEPFDFMGFYSVWVAPFHEQPFILQRKGDR